jgi:hypothetical protein
MDHLTPVEKAKKLGIYNIDIINIFPTLILQDFYREVSAISQSQMSQYVLTQDLFSYVILKVKMSLL